MKTMKRNRKIWVVLMSMFLLATLPAVTSAQGRGRGRGQDKKLYKFVNGHDARDGRWDGRGPRSGQRIPRSAIYQRRPYYGYQSYTYGHPKTYYRSQYTYGSYQPQNTNRFYSYRYSQPYFANRHTYSWANPTYRYNESWYRERQRRNRLRLGIRVR